MKNQADHYIDRNGETQGPYTINQMRSMWASGKLDGNTLHCRGGDTAWKPLHTMIDELETPPPGTCAIGVGRKSRGVYIIIGLLGGLLGLHSFYAGYYKRGGWQIFWTLTTVGIPITMCWVFIDICSVNEDANGLAFA